MSRLLNHDAFYVKSRISKSTTTKKGINFNFVMRNLLKCFYCHCTTGSLFGRCDWDMYFTTIIDHIPSLVRNPERLGECEALD